MDISEKALQAHAQWRGKIEVTARAQADSAQTLALAYTPGVAAPCREIHKEPDLAYTYTRKWNTVAIVTDGSAVLGLGDIGPAAALPVMEGKAVLFKAFGDVDAVPICLDTQDVDEIVNTVRFMAPGFGGINLEDIAAPRCFEIERRLKESLSIPVFHDDQHGTAIVVLSALLNAAQVAGRDIPSLRIVLCGAGAAGCAIAELLLSAGAGDLTLYDRKGILHPSEDWLNSAQRDLAQRTNPRGLTGDLSTALTGADVFIGVSGPGVLTKEMIGLMGEKPIIFAMANPTPEIMPEEALAAGAFIVGTGRSDYPNQINNVLAFPGIFRGALDARAGAITQEMKLAAAQVIAQVARQDGLHREYIMPNAFDPRVGKAVAQAVANVEEQTK